MVLLFIIFIKCYIIKGKEDERIMEYKQMGVEVKAMSNKIRLTVGGIEYTITSDDEESYVRKVGDQLNKRLDELSRHNPFLSTTMVAVLAALEFCDDSLKATAECNSLKMELKRAVEDAACARLEADEARREIERLGRENRLLRAGKSAL